MMLPFSAISKTALSSQSRRQQSLNLLYGWILLPDELDRGRSSQMLRRFSSIAGIGESGIVEEGGRVKEDIAKWITSSAGIGGRQNRRSLGCGAGDEYRRLAKTYEEKCVLGKFFSSLFPWRPNILLYLRENAMESNKGSWSRLFGPINHRVRHSSFSTDGKEECPSNSIKISPVTFTDISGDMEDLPAARKDNWDSTCHKECADAKYDGQHQQSMVYYENEDDSEVLDSSENSMLEFDKVEIEMLPTVILVGRPNVGKSALFNRLIRRREALVYNTPDGHVTRDIREGVAKLGDLRFKVLDSAGLEMAATSGSVLARTARMTASVLRSSHLAIFLIDARAGLHPLDLEVGKWLRKHASHLRIVLALNKAEAIYDDSNGVLMAAMGEAHSLGFGDPIPISAETGVGLAELYESLCPLLEDAMSRISKDAWVPKGNAAMNANDKLPLQLAIVGRPNVGKSTLLNALLLEERVLTGPEPGLTRDSVRAQFEFEARKIYLVDTAGWLQRKKVKEGPSALSAMHARRSIMRAHIVALVLDGEEIAKERSSMRHSESALARRVTEEGRGLVVVVNKMDLLKGKENAKLRAKVMKAVPEEIQTILPQVTGIPVVFISALEGKGRTAVMRKVVESYEKWCVRLSTARLNRWLRKVMARHSWKNQASKGPKVKYFTQVKARPPTFVAFVAGSSELSETDMRFLTRSLKEDFDLGGIPIRILQRSVQRKSKPDQKALSGRKISRTARVSSSDKRNVVSPCEL